ncbi:MAG TPA: FCD domain-containing protein [Thermopetrobacter sp.]|nr:FCD domain-containing protein [Thermopetrobacter sp.]
MHSSVPNSMLGERNGAPRTAIEETVERLREDILSGHFPPGSKLRIEELRKRYGGGVSTIREAMARLMSESLVVSEEQRGFRAAPMSLRDFTEISDMRKFLECRALRKSIEIGDDDWEAQLVAAYHKLTKVEERLHNGVREAGLQRSWAQANKAYHDALVSACGNSWLMRIRALLHRQSERYLRYSLVHSAPTRDVHQEHEAIYKAAMERDADTACELICRHIDNTVRVIKEALSQRLSEHDAAADHIGKAP